MTQTRVYLPLTAADVRALADGATVGANGGYAVTAALRAAQPSADEEEYEFAALTEAAAAATGLAAGGRRVVAAADVDAEIVDDVSGPEPDTPAQIQLIASVPLRRVVSFHVDEHPGSGQEDLLWYDVTELDEVVHLTS